VKISSGEREQKASYRSISSLLPFRERDYLDENLFKRLSKDARFRAKAAVIMKILQIIIYLWIAAGVLLFFLLYFAD
jgi:hypothetical protein